MQKFFLYHFPSFESKILALSQNQKAIILFTGPTNFLNYFLIQHVTTAVGCKLLRKEELSLM